MFLPVVVFGCGFTGRRVAARLAAQGIGVVATSRSPETLVIEGVRAERLDAAAPPWDLRFVPKGARVLYSIPTLEAPDPSPMLFAELAARNPVRVVYLSTTGVYGGQLHVDEQSQAAPVRPPDHARMEAEQSALSGPWSGLVLRPAAIYGPGRGIHISMREGRYRMGGDGSNFVSRIHVEDLATHCEAALCSELTGAWPVADEEPCTALEIAEFCSGLLSVPMPPRADAATLHHTRQANRRVDGSAVRRALGIGLRYPSYRTGIPASIPALA